MFAIYFSYSCGYKKAFDEYSNILMEKYPDIQIRGFNYDPPGMIKIDNDHFNPSNFLSFRTEHVHLEDSRSSEISVDGSHR